VEEVGGVFKALTFASVSLFERPIACGEVQITHAFIALLADPATTVIFLLPLQTNACSHTMSALFYPCTETARQCR
jgi:hypothetical protein